MNASAPTQARPSVCVVTRTKDRPIMLPRAFESVRSQSYPDLVWVIVNDGGERAYVDAVADKGRAQGIDVRVVHHDESKGMEAASNAGVAACESDLVVIHDDDDSWHPDFLRVMTRSLDELPGHAGVVCHSMRIDERIEAQGAGERVVEASRRPFNSWLRSIYLHEISEENQFPPISFLFRREHWVRVGGFDESLPVLGDWDFNLKVLLNADIGVVPQVLANYHHRVAGSAYANSVVGGVEKHVAYDAILRNRHLRNDIAAGRPGLGFLLADGRSRLVYRKHLMAANLVLRGARALARPFRAPLLRLVGR